MAMEDNWVVDSINNSEEFKDIDSAAELYATWHWGNFPREMLVEDFKVAANWQLKRVFDWLEKNNYLSDSREILQKEFENQQSRY
jgi:hypothetical protein